MMFDLLAARAAVISSDYEAMKPHLVAAINEIRSLELRLGIRKKRSAERRTNAIKARKEKRCSGKCKTVKKLKEFSKNRLALDGHQSMCKPCMSEYQKQPCIVASKKRSRVYK